ncbi:MAG: choice-of-anchor tandem repeat NxxGxxAF-containing protein, partial [Planctomycetota bacterium]
MSHRFPNFALVLACFFVSSFGVFDSAEILFAQMEVDFEVAAITGGDAPGTEETFELVNFPVINDEGQIAFVATLLSPTEFLAGSGVWSDVSGSIELIAVGGMQAPGTPATTFFDANIFDVTSNRHHAFRRIVLNDAGSIAFEAKLQDFELEIDTSNDIGVWVCQNGNFELLIREGDVPPGFPAGIALDFFDSENSQTDFRFNSFGTIALNTGLSGPGLTVFDRVVACGDETSLEIIAQDGESAPGTGDNFLSVGNPLLNDFGEVAFNSILPAGFSGDQAVFAEFSEVLFPVVVEGDLAPGVPLGNPRFEGVGGCSFNNAGQQIISGNAVGEDGDDFIFTGGLWLANGSSLVNVLLDNDPIVSLVDGCL